MEVPKQRSSGLENKIKCKKKEKKKKKGEVLAGGGIPHAFGELKPSRDNGAGCASGLGFGGLLGTTPD